MSQASVTRRYHFAAAHRLHTERLSEDDNRTVFGKCNNPNGHGHNYTLFVTVRDEIDPQTGRAVAFEPLDRLIQETVVERFDHRDLNQDLAFADRTTTGENLVLLIWDIVSARLPKGRLVKIGLIETRDNYFEYTGPAAQPAAVGGRGR